MENPVRNLMSDPEGKSTPIGTELAEKVKMRREADKALAPTSAPVSPVAPAKPAPVDLVNPGNKGKTGRQAIEEMNKKYPDLPKMHKGGTVPKTGPYMMKEGEKVLTPEKHDKLRHAMGMAMDALSHEPEQDKEPEMPQHLREMHIKELHTGGFHVTKHDGKGGMTEHGAPHNDAVVGHFMDHMAHPDEGEEDAEMGNHGIESMEKAVGYK